MKVRNIVFSGFAAAVLMGVAVDANAEIDPAATHVVTKGYIDDLDLTEVGAAGSYIQKVSQSGGQVAATKTGFAQEITSASDHSNAPTSKAVHDYVTTAVNGVQYGGDNAYITVDNTNDKIGLTNIAGEASGITDESTALTTANAVFDYVAANDTTYTSADAYITVDNTNDKIGLNNITDDYTQINGTDDGLTTGRAVHQYVTTTVNNLDVDEVGAAGSYIQKVVQENGAVTATVTPFDTAISLTDPSETTAPTSQAVVNYVTQLTGGVLPNGCDGENDSCALVKLNGTLQWVNLTTPVEDQDQTTGG